MTESVESPERIWIESEGGCPYFYHEDELSDVGSPVTEYVRADKLRAEIEALRAEVERVTCELISSSSHPVGRLCHEAAAAFEAAQMGLRYAVRVWVLSDEIEWSEAEIDEVVESIISDAKKEASND